MDAGQGKKRIWVRSTARVRARFNSARGAIRISRQLLVLLGCLAVAVVFAVKLGADWLVEGRHIVATDDAYVRAETTIVAPRVAGYVEAIAVRENEPVAAGALLVRIEPGDYRIALEAAEHRVLTQRAAVDRIAAQITAQHMIVAQAKAQLVAEEVNASRTEVDLARTTQLAERAISSKKTLDTAVSDKARAAAVVEAARAAAHSAEAAVGILAAQQREAESVVRELHAALDKARRDRDATEIRAPFGGVVGNLAVKRGQYVAPGTRLLALVPLERVYIEAAFKETQIARLSVGQKVVVRVDAFAGMDIVGRVESMAPAAGTEFSLLPPENATGNFTKIVRRVQVRISVPAEIAQQGLLRPGLSVVVNVDTRRRIEPGATPPEPDAGSGAAVAAPIVKSRNR